MARDHGRSALGTVALLLTGIVVAQTWTAEGSAEEVCRFAGTTDYAGRATVTTDVSEAGGVTRVDVTATLEARAVLWFHIRYFVEEISTWRAGELESVAVNNRYIFGGGIVRQQWDVFKRVADGLQGYRVQGKTLAEFRRHHPAFVQHWDPATFGWPWLQDYQAASPERRPDLDLTGAALDAGVRPPLAMAFYWIRFLPPGGRNIPVFLPGFKDERLMELPIAPGSGGGATEWRAPLLYSSLNRRPGSTATAWTSPDGRLLQLALDVHASSGSGRGLIREEGCEGTPVTQQGWRP